MAQFVPTGATQQGVTNAINQRVAIAGDLIVSGEDWDTNASRSNQPAGAAFVFVLSDVDGTPSITPIDDLAINEGSPLLITPEVVDPEEHPFTLEWSGDIPSNAIINGVFDWTPGEDEGPAEYRITVTARQDNNPSLSDSVEFTIEVREVNEPPVLDAIADVTGTTGDVVQFTASAMDPDVPADALTFSIDPVSGTLDGAVIDPVTGAFECACAAGEHVVEVLVTDDDPLTPLSDSHIVTITVIDPADPGGGTAPGGDVLPPIEGLPDTVEDSGLTLTIDRDCVVERGPTAPPVGLITPDGCPNIQLQEPAGALPPGLALVLAPVSDLDGLPAPDGIRPLLGFIVQLQDETGEVLAGALPGAVTIVVTVDAVLLPANEREVLIAYWDGGDMVEIPATVTVLEDGSLTLEFQVNHFTIFSVLAQPGRGLLTPTPALSGVSLASWSGGPMELLPTATSYWVTQSGRFTSYIPGAPAFVNASFMALFPNGMIPSGTMMIVVR